MVMIRVPTLTGQHRQDHACVLIMACRLHPPPHACRRWAPDPVSPRESLEGLLKDQDVLAGHGCRISPRTGLRVPPSASMPGWSAS